MKYLVASALALVIAAPAAAQTERAVNSGVRVEGRVGWDRATFKEKIDAPTVVVTDKVSKSGVAWGLEAGYDYVTSGPLLIGGYAGIEGSTVEDCFGPNGRRVCTELGRNITVGARAGYVLRRGVIYLKGGYSNGRVTRTPGFAGDPTLPPPPPPGAGDPTLPPPPGFEPRDKKNHGGFHVGAGGEVMISPNAYVKLEYVFTKYSKEKFDLPLVTNSFDVRRHQVVAGAGFRF